MPEPTVRPAPSLKTLSKAGDIAQWDVSERNAAEVWLGGTYVNAAIKVEMYREGFGWTTVRVESNQSPQIVYSGEITLTQGVIAVGSSAQLIGAEDLRVTLKSIKSGSLICDIAFPKKV